MSSGESFESIPVFPDRSCAPFDPAGILSGNGLFILELESLMTLPAVETVESRLSSVRCAICKASSFAIDRRNLHADGEWKGMCMKCRYTFPVHTDMEFYQRAQPDLPYFLRTVPCPKCAARGVDLDFRATLSVREAYYFVTCQTCKHSFPERSSFEAFE